QVVQTVTAGIQVNSFALDLGGQRLYLAGGFPGSVNAVQILDLQTGTVLETINTAVVVALSPDRARLYVVDFGGTLTVRDTATLEPVGTAPVGATPSLAAPQAVVVTPDGGTLWVVSATDNTARAVDTQALSLVATLSAGLSPIGLSVVASRGELYVLSSGSNTVSVVDSADNTLRSTALDRFGLTVPLGLIVPADGSAAYVVNGVAPTTVAFDPATGTGLATLPFGDSRPALNVATSLTRNEVDVGTTTPPGVWALDLSPRAPQRLFPLALPPRVLALSLDERRLYVVTEVGGERRHLNHGLRRRHGGAARPGHPGPVSDHGRAYGQPGGDAPLCPAPEPAGGVAERPAAGA
ncbi:MAG: YncE family protein, partial [Candidatus Methylomirabilia bacterium]